MKRTCLNCDKEKDAKQFYHNSGFGHHLYCISCVVRYKWLRPRNRPKKPWRELKITFPKLPEVYMETVKDLFDV